MFLIWRIACQIANVSFEGQWYGKWQYYNRSGLGVIDFILQITGHFRMSVINPPFVGFRQPEVYRFRSMSL